MTILYLLIPLSIMMVVIAIIAFRWAIKNRQFDDLDAPSMIPLLDDSDAERERQRRNSEQEKQS
ncbi:cbb3-type cytochrome oxidase assembly protein CcoS [Cardiobacteriaceae bacterium TAE3-ERU3]|nr:cbb3-type cytochrome oxidase assembly protein CcoS [Cardiobacteriaceae bacterium TAE3-ERU3]